MLLCVCETNKKYFTTYHKKDKEFNESGYCLSWIIDFSPLSIIILGCESQPTRLHFKYRWGVPVQGKVIYLKYLLTIRNMPWHKILVWLLTCVKTFQSAAYGVVLGCFNMHEFGLDFSIQYFWSHWITSTRPKPAKLRVRLKP